MKRRSLIGGIAAGIGGLVGRTGLADSGGHPSKSIPKLYGGMPAAYYSDELWRHMPERSQFIPGFCKEVTPVEMQGVFHKAETEYRLRIPMDCVVNAKDPVEAWSRTKKEASILYLRQLRDAVESIIQHSLGRMTIQEEESWEALPLMLNCSWDEVCMLGGKITPHIPSRHIIHAVSYADRPRLSVDYPLPYRSFSEDGEFLAIELHTAVAFEIHPKLASKMIAHKLTVPPSKAS